MDKRGQVTIFIIIAILIVVAGILFFIFRDSLIKEKPSIPSEIAPIKNYVENCIEENLVKVVYAVGEGGGYFFPPILSDSRGYTYYFYGGKNYFPSLDKIEDELSNGLGALILLCVDDFKSFSNYEIDKKSVEVKTEVLDEKIIFEITFPLRISYKGNSMILEDFGERNYYVKLGAIHRSIKDLINQNYYNEESICISCFAEMMMKEQVSVNYIEGGLGNSTIIISDYNEKYDRSFNYIFAV